MEPAQHEINCTSLEALRGAPMWTSQHAALSCAINVDIRTHKGSGRRRISIDDLRNVAHMPQLKAAKELGVGATRFKMACKELGWHNWPYRKVKSVRKARLAVDTLEDQLHAKDKVKSVLEEEEKQILHNPSKCLDEDFKRFRQTIYKQDHGKKKTD